MEVTQEQINEARESLIEFINENITPPVRKRPDGFGITVNEYAVRANISVGMARTKLNELVEKKLLKCEPMSYKPGTPPVVYYKPEGDE